MLDTIPLRGVIPAEPPAVPPGRGTSLTTPEFARRYRIGEEKVLGLIRRGELRAVNTASALCGKPRWVITPEALAEFEKRRAGGPAPKPPKKRRRAGEIDFFPD